jgi:glycine betaine/proline transport system ATP-binding protein
LRKLIEQPGEQHLIKGAFIKEAVAAKASDSMQDILPNVAGHPWALPILDDEGNYLGAISKNLFLRTLHRNQEDEQTSPEQARNGATQ